MRDGVGGRVGGGSTMNYCNLEFLKPKPKRNLKVKSLVQNSSHGVYREPAHQCLGEWNALYSQESVAGLSVGKRWVQTEL